jgi:hypothetical protein
MDDMYKACQVPGDVLKKLETEALVKICFDFPVPPLFALFNTPQQAFLEYFSNFNGIRELFIRKDAGQYLLKKYTKMSLSEFNPLWELHQKGRFISHYKLIETLLSQPQIVESLNTKAKKDLIKEAVHKMDEKLSKNDLFSSYSIEINIWLISRLLYTANKLTSQEYRQKIQTSLETGMFVDIDINTLYQQAKKYIYENE